MEEESGVITGSMSSIDASSMSDPASRRESDAPF